MWSSRIVFSAALILLILLVLMFAPKAFAHDPDHRENDPWYESFKMPGTDTSCCGVSDAYYCNNLEFKDGETFCTVTDTRDNVTRDRLPVPVGTKVLIPPKKIIQNEVDPENPLKMIKGQAARGNPTGNGVVWMRAGYVDNQTGEVLMYDPKDITVFCYVAPDLT
jgi:hypothetical protein